MIYDRKIIIELKILNKKIDEILELNNDRKRMIINNFISGLAKGMGISLGVIILGATTVIVLRNLISLPIIGKYIAQIVYYVDMYLNR